jgi:carboxy-cis,cis-muconate cyclase
MFDQCFADLGLSNSSYWSDEVALSATNQYLWATSRSRSTNSTGYISAFSLELSGAIKEQLFLLPTTTSGGAANSVAPAFFSDEWAALTDNSVGFVQIWRLGANGTNAEVVATVELNDGGCCGNVLWYD